MAISDCIGRIANKTGVSKQQAEDVLNRVYARAEKLNNDYDLAANEMAQEAVTAAKKDRLDALLNANIRSKILTDIDKAGGISEAETTLRSLLHGTNVGSRDSVEAMWRGNAANWQAALSHQLQKAGVEKAAISGELDSAVAQELWAMNAGEKGRATGNNPARAIAEAIKPALDYARERLNQAGAQIGDAVDYVAHTTHDPTKMRRAAGAGQTVEQAFDAWWEFTQPLLADKTFDSIVPKEGEAMVDAQRRFGRSVYEALVSGVHMTPDGAFGLNADPEGYIPPAYEGTRNVARKVSQPRVLFWKDGVAWNSYMEEFGRARSLTEGVMQTLDKSAQQLALMDKLGTNPAANLNTIIRRVQELYRSDLDGVKTFQGKVQGLNNVLSFLDGSANIPANEMWARISGSYRTLTAMSDLGGVGVTHFASIWPTVTSEMAQHGESRLGTIGNLIQAMVQGKGSAERQEVLADLGAYSNGLTRDMFARWQPDDPIPGKLSALANTFMKYTGIHYVFDNTQAAVREMLSSRLARSVNQAFDELEPHQAQILGKYGIGSGEWDLLRAVDNLPVADGHAYLTPKDAFRINPDAAAAFLKSAGQLAEGAAPDMVERAVARLQNTLSDRLFSYYGDAAAHAVVTPGARERALLLGSTKRGTIGGELTRFVAQFKMWPVAAMNQMIGRDIHMSLSRGEMAWNLGILAAMSAAGGYMRMTVNDVALGNAPRNPLDPKTMLAALAQGGGVGILGDFLFGNAMRSRFNSGLVSTALGPVAGDLDSLIKIYSQWMNGKAGWPDLARFATRHIPFANLVYLKGALDYMVFYHLYEAASPGWWERVNRNMMKEQGRTMAGYTPGGSIPWTPWGIGSASMH